MGMINDVDQPGSDMESYINNLETSYNRQMEKINFMKTRLMNFKQLLKEEELLSQKFVKANEMWNNMYESQSNNSRLDANMYEDI